MITGLETLRFIENAYAEAREEEMRIGAALSEASQRAAKLRRDRLTQLNALAQVKFELIRGGELVEDLDAAEKQAKAALDQINRNLEDASRRRDASAEALRKAEAEKDDRARDDEAAALALQNFEHDVAARLGEDAKWRGLNERIASLQGTLAQAQRKASQAEADRERKKIPYEGDPLFMYLWSRKFGEPDYKASALVRYIDGLVAKLVDFKTARGNYQLLNDIPGRLQAHAHEIAATLQTEQRRMSLLLQSRIEEAGGAALQQKAREKREALEASEAARAAAARAFEEANRQYYLLIGRNNEGAFAEAVTMMRENDERDEVLTLFREAERTKTEKDQRIVETIDALTKALGKTEADISQLRTMLDAAAAKRTEIERARAEFQRRRYDYPGTTFRNESAIGDVIGGILKGALAGAVLGQILRQGYQRPPLPPWGGTIDPGPFFPPGGAFGGAPDDEFTTGGGF
jgi:hypothetical protein